MDLAQLSQALSEFALHEPTRLPLHQVRLFLEVARHEPVTFEHLEQALGLTHGSVSRSVSALAQVNRHGEAGYRLLKVARDPEPGRRRYLVSLSANGRLLKNQLERIE